MIDTDVRQTIANAFDFDQAWMPAHPSVDKGVVTLCGNVAAYSEK